MPAQTPANAANPADQSTADPGPATAADRSTPLHGRDLDALILPNVRERLRAGILFVLVSMVIFTGLSFSAGDPNLQAKLLINAARILGLVVAWAALRGEGSERGTAIAGVFGIGLVLVPAIELTRLRNDVFPLAFFTVSMASFAAMLVPWGPVVQAVLAATCLATLVVGWAVLDHATAVPVSTELWITIFNAFVLTVVISAVFKRWQRLLRTRLEDARKADEELQAMHADLEGRVVERTAELEFANRELEGFSYTVSHDLRSPLRAIAGFSRLILEEDGRSLSPTTLDRLTKIEAATLRMDTLIDDMLVLARVSRSALQTEAVDLSALAREIGDTLRIEKPDRRVNFIVGAVPHVLGDKGLLRIALDNLLRNAWKFTASRDPAEIEIFGRVRGSMVTCSVRDNGIGFDMQFRGKLFRPFERIHDEKDVEGTGIGLATVARIVHRLGGEVDADGALGQGATFSMRLPVAPRSPSGQSPAATRTGS